MKRWSCLSRTFGSNLTSQCNRLPRLPRPASEQDMIGTNEDEGATPSFTFIPLGSDGRGQGATSLSHLIASGYVVGLITLRSGLRLSMTSSTTPYLTASSAVRMKSRSVSRETLSRGWPVCSEIS